MQDVLGRVYGLSFGLPESFERSDLYGYEAQISFKDILIEYLNDALLPTLRSENQFLRELDIQETFVTISPVQIVKTIQTYAAYLSTVADNADEIMALFQNSTAIALNDKLRNTIRY